MKALDFWTSSWRLIFSIQPHDRPGTTLNSFGRCLKIVDSFRRLVKRRNGYGRVSVSRRGRMQTNKRRDGGWRLIPLGGTVGRCRRAGPASEGGSYEAGLRQPA
jgi:hypothetical protein